MIKNSSSNIIVNIAFTLLIILLLLVQPFGAFGQHTSKESIDTSIDYQGATLAAQSFLMQKDKLETHSIKSYEILKQDELPLCYFFYLNPMGYIAVSTHHTLPAIVAYSFTSSSESISQESPLEYLLCYDLSTRLSYISNLDDKTLAQREYQWQTYASLQPMDTSDFQQWPKQGVSLTDGWIETQWHQDSPYNDFCPIDPDSGERGIAGCPSIAMGQILYFHQTIHNVSFDDRDDYYHNYGNYFRIDDDYEEYDFLSFPELNSHLETVKNHFAQEIPLTNTDIAALVFGCGVAAKQVYTPQVSGTFGVEQAYDAYLKFNCTTIDLIKNDTEEIYERIQDNMKQVLPVHLAVLQSTPNGGGHNLIIDGYNTEGYYHLNFGWGGSYDGWYLLPEELPFDLTIFEGVIVDICKAETEADVSTDGTIQVQNSQPGSQINASFTISNIGTPTSQLDWEITSFPDWGAWTFSQLQGTDLTPEDGPVQINVSIVLPDKKNTELTGYVYITNIEDITDQSVIPISITTPKNYFELSWLRLFFSNYPLFHSLFFNI